MFRLVFPIGSFSVSIVGLLCLKFSLYVGICFGKVQQPARFKTAAEVFNSSQVDSLAERGWGLRKISPDSSVLLAHWVVRLSDSLGRFGALGLGHSTLGYYHKQLRDYDAAFFHHSKALEARVLDRDSVLVASTFNNLGGLKNMMGDYGSSWAYFQSGLNWLPVSGNEKLRVKLLNGGGLALLNLGQSEEAGLLLHQGLDLRKQVDFFRVGDSYLHLGILHSKLKEWATANLYYKEAISAFKSVRNFRAAAKGMANLGAVFLATHDEDSASFYFDSALKLFLEFGDPQGEAEVLNNIGNNFLDQGEPLKARSYFQQSLKIQFSLENPRGIAFANFNLGLAEQELGNYRMAIDLLSESVRYFQTSGPLSAYEEGLFGLFECYGEARLYQKAFETSKLYLALRDSQRIVEAALRTQIDADRLDKIRLKEDSILTVQKLGSERLKTLEIQTQNERQQVVLIGLVIALILLGLLFFAIQRWQRNKRKAAEAERGRAIAEREQTVVLKKKLEADKKALEAEKGRAIAEKEQSVVLKEKLEADKKVLEAEKEKARVEMEMAQKLQLQSEVHAQELQREIDQTRKEISMNLHDGVGGELSIIKSNMEELESSFGRFENNLQSNFTSLLEMIISVHKKVRNISHEMFPPVLEKFGLEIGVEEMIKPLQQRAGLSIAFHSIGMKGVRFRPEVEYSLYQVIYELLQNINKHAMASAITVQLIRDPHSDFFQLSVEDNGKGFDTQELEYGAGMGLQNIKNRVKSIRGELDIDSRPGHGTTIMADFKLSEFL